MIIGVTIFIRKGKRSIWSCGADQNCVFLVKLLERCKGVEKVYLINGGDGEQPHKAMMFDGLGLDIVRLDDVIDELDLLIEAGAQIEAKAIAHIRRRGGKAVAYRFGNNHVLDIERMIHGKPPGSIFNGSQFDEVWTNPQHMHTCASYWEACYRAPVRCLPHLWEPTFVDKAVAEMPRSVHFGYKPRQRKRIVVIEPNINVVKTAHIPMLVAELAYRQRPELFGDMMVWNALDMKKHLTFRHFANNLDIVKDGVCSFEGRINTPMLLAKHADIVVSHQWENALNYAYYEAIYGGYPLVHSSPMLPLSVGHRYDSFNAHQGASMLLLAMSGDEKSRDGNSIKRANLLRSVSTSDRHNIAQHEKALSELKVSVAQAA